MALPEPLPASLADPPRPRVLWIGATAGPELRLAHSWLVERAQLIVADTPGAAVTLAPESFMGPSWASGSGTTGNDGDVVVSADAVRAKGFAGVYPGIYRITVAPAGGDPAKPLTHAATGTTELGQDVAPDNRDLELPRQLAMTTRRGKPAAK